MKKGIRTMRFIGAHSGVMEDVFKCRENRGLYVRQHVDDTHVRWCTANEHKGLLEADTPLRAGLTIKVLGVDGQPVFLEDIEKDPWNGFTIAEKRHPFSWETFRQKALDAQIWYDLVCHDKWRADMLAHRPDNRIDPDNWLYGSVKYGEETELEVSYYLGVKITLKSTQVTHKLCGASWTVYELVDEKSGDCLGICGYKYC